MFLKTSLIALAVLVLVTMACGITINIPQDEFDYGPTRTTEINVQPPDAPEADVTLEFGAGKLEVSPGAGEALVTGEATFNVDQLEPVVEIDGEDVRISSGSWDFDRFPRFGRDLENTWELKLGEMPMNLVLNAGAYQGDLELGGLALKSLEIADGAADVKLQFSQPNLVEMEFLRYTTGASNVRLTGLANANFTSMVFRSGAGDYTLDFSGELQRDAVVTIESGISRVVVIVPEGMNAEVNFTGGLSSVDVDGDWQRSGDEYTLAGEGPRLTINIDMGAGSLELKTN
jgi:hypothetical protein